MRQWEAKIGGIRPVESGFELLGHIADPGGVFVLRLKGRVVYVGKCKNLYARASAAVTKAKKPFRATRYWTAGDFHSIPLLFDEVWVKFCGETEAARLTLELIERHRPEQQPPVRTMKGLEIPTARHRGVDLLAIAKAAGVDLDRVRENRQQIR